MIGQVLPYKTTAMTPLRREDIIRHTIHAMYAVDTRKDDLDFCVTYLVLDSGIVTFLPLACSPFIAISLPSDAEQLAGEVVERCLSSPISRVLASQEPDGFIDPESLVVEFESGNCMAEKGVAPHGTGLAGLRCYHTDELDFSDLTDYWTLDRAADERL